MVYKTSLAKRYWVRKAVLAVLFIITGVVLMKYPIISHPILRIVAPPIPFIAAIFEFWSYWRARRMILVLEEDGGLRLRGKLIQARWMKEIHVLEWRGRYLAKLDYSDGNQSDEITSIKLDGWVYNGLDMIIKAIYERLHPEEQG